MAKQRFVSVRMQNKFDTESNWRANDPVLLKGELALSVPGNTVENVTDGVIHIKVGDGIHKWSELAYGTMGMVGPTGPAGAPGATGPRGQRGEAGVAGERGAPGVGIKSISTSVKTEGDNQKVTLTITKDDNTYTNTDFDVPKGIPGAAGNAGRSMWNASVVIDQGASSVAKSVITPTDANILVNDTIVDAKGQTFLATANAAPAAAEVKIKFTSNWGAGKVDQDSYDEDKSVDQEWKDTTGKEIDLHDKWIKVTGTPILGGWPTTGGTLVDIFGNPDIIARPITGVIGNSGWNPSGIFATLKDRFDDLEDIRKGDFELVTTGSVFKPIKNVFADKDQFTAFVTGSNTNFENIKKGTFEVEFDSGVKVQLGQTIKDKLDKGDKNTFNNLLTGATGFKNLDEIVGGKIGADAVPGIIKTTLDDESSEASKVLGNRFVKPSVLTGYATQTDIKPFITSGALDGYATQSWVGDRGFLTGSALDGYAKQEWVNGKGFLTGSALSGYAKEEWVNGKGFLTGSALDGYAKQEWVNGKGFLTGSALDGYAKQDWVSGNFTSSGIFNDLKGKTETAIGDISNIKDTIGTSGDASGSSSLFGQIKDALEEASSASSKADNASSAASSASSKADNALSQAASAVSKADSAVGTANSASSKADSAMSRADSAFGQSENAVSWAGDAIQKSEEAKTEASNAATKADQINVTVNSLSTQITAINNGISTGSLTVNGTTLLQILNTANSANSSSSSNQSGLASLKWLLDFLDHRDSPHKYLFVKSPLLPEQTNTHFLGDATHQWTNVYTNSIGSTSYPCENVYTANLFFKASTSPTSKSFKVGYDSSGTLKYSSLKNTTDSQTDVAFSVLSSSWQCIRIYGGFVTCNAADGLKEIRASDCGMKVFISAAIGEVYRGALNNTRPINCMIGPFYSYSFTILFDDWYKNTRDKCYYIVIGY